MAGFNMVVLPTRGRTNGGYSSPVSRLPNMRRQLTALRDQLDEESRKHNSNMGLIRRLQQKRDNLSSVLIGLRVMATQPPTP